MGKVVDPDLLRQRLQMPLQIIANAERRSGRVRKQERAGIISVWVPRNPRLNLASEVRRHRDVIVALRCFCLADSILTLLALLQRFVDSEARALATFKIGN